MCLYEKTPTFFFIITVKNRQNSWHTITKHKQQCCNHSCPTRRKKKRKVEKTLPGIYTHSSSYSCSCSFRIRTMSGSVTSVWIIRKLPEPSQNEWWRTTNRRWQQQHPKPTNDNPTVDSRRRTASSSCSTHFISCFTDQQPSTSSSYQRHHHPDGKISSASELVCAVRLASPLVSCSFSFSFSFSFSLMHSFVLIV